MKDIKDIAIQCLKDESQALLDLIPLIGDDFLNTIELIFKCRGKLIITGVGKSGHVGAKIAATLASTGTPSFFLNPVEALHGDLGMIAEGDIVFAISNSGQTDEVLRVIPFLKNRNVPIIGMTQDPNSPLAQHSLCHITVFVKKEACPLNLAPTSSTTAMLAMGDAIACSLIEKRNFKATDYAKFHPGGSLGKKLLLNVKDIMHTRNLPIVDENDSVENMLSVMTKGELGIAVVIKEKRVAGLVTNGDMRKALEKNKEFFFGLAIKEIANPAPVCIYEKEPLSNADIFFKEKNITMALVLDSDDNFTGILDIRKM